VSHTLLAWVTDKCGPPCRRGVFAGPADGPVELALCAAHGAHVKRVALRPATWRPKAFRVGTKSWSGCVRCSGFERLRVMWLREGNQALFTWCRVSRTDAPK